MKIAIHTKIDYKPNNDDKAEAYESLSADFENVDITIKELAEHIALGHSFCAQHNGRRKGENFVGTEVIAVDIDNGLTIVGALESEFVKKYAAFIYTTPNHSEMRNRFRVVFELERMIDDPLEMRRAYQGLIRKFGGDKACKDPCRFFFGSKGGQQFMFCKKLPNSVLAELIQWGTELDGHVDALTTAKKFGGSIRRSNMRLEPNQLVKTANGEMGMVSDFLEKTKVHCPMHVDNHASAFIVTSRNKVNGVYCSTCAGTHWPPHISNSDLWAFDFYEIDGRLRKIEYEEDPVNYLGEDAAPEFFSNDGRVVKSGSEVHLTDIEFSAGIILIRSPKGSGKSHQLRRLVEHCKAKNLSGLLIGHRQSLISALAKNLGLACYPDKVTSWGEPIPVSEYYAICLDSMQHRLDPRKDKFDVIIIDESEQVFAHLTSDTLLKQRRECFSKLE